MDVLLKKAGGKKLGKYQVSAFPFPSISSSAEILITSGGHLQTKV
jgi:hypothetical protein